MSVIGIDLGGTKCAGAIFINNGKMIHKKIVPLQKRKGMEVGLLIQDHLRNLLNFANNENVGIESIGISVPGISYSKTGKVWAPNIPGWDEYPLLHEIQSNIKSIKIKIDSDRTCYILGEAWQGAAKGCKDAIFISVGTGIGAGILVNGEILRGSNDITGAIGWWGLDKPYQSEYKECGCFEYHASGEGLVKVANEFLSHDPSYNGILRGKTSDAINTRDIFNAYNQKDPLAVKIMKEAVEYWGMTVANLVSLFNPEKIIFGGGVFGPAVNFLDEIMKEAKKWAQPISINHVKLVGSMCGSDAGLIGAGYLALRNL